MKKAIIAVGTALVFLLGPDAVFSASREQQIVARVDSATVLLKGHNLVIQALGMGRTPTSFGRGGWLVHRGAQGVLNKDGLLEYNLMFNGVANYTGFKMQPIKATYRERSVPQGVKGVRIFGQFNEVNSLLPEPKKPKSFLPSFGHKKRGEPETTEHP